MGCGGSLCAQGQVHSAVGPQVVPSRAWGGTFHPRDRGARWDEGDRTWQANPEVAAHSGWHTKRCSESCWGLWGRKVSEWAVDGRSSDHEEDKGRVGGDSASQEGPVRSWAIYSPRLGGREVVLGARLTPSSVSPHGWPLLAGASCPGPSFKATSIPARVTQECPLSRRRPRTQEGGRSPR